MEKHDWHCPNPNCGYVCTWTYMDLVERGCPVCPECDEDLVLTDRESDTHTETGGSDERIRL